ncbi:MAG: hypothetical protein JSV80_18445 [Acidobacteriota bacterium]|nr:MAG: hypothetical protein JSV80_18445 [Acidobacteriota bacterium]
MTERPEMAPRSAGLLRYLKEAFLFRWNLLLFLGGVAAAAISPAPDALLALIGAAELTYLAMLSTIPRFRAAIDAKYHAKRSARRESRSSQDRQLVLQQMLDNLDPQARERFHRLRGRCVEMQKIARGVRGRARIEKGAADELRTPSLDRLLWVFLRLLHSRQALERFLATTNEGEIRQRLEQLRQQIAAAEQREDERIGRALQDSVATAELRLSNYRKAERNAEFVGIELDRIEEKIQALSEMAISRQDPDFISRQVDSVAESMSQTERAIGELDEITGITADLEGPPAILEAELSS